MKSRCFVHVYAARVFTDTFLIADDGAEKDVQGICLLRSG